MTDARGEFLSSSFMYKSINLDRDENKVKIPCSIKVEHEKNLVTSNHDLRFSPINVIGTTISGVVPFIRFSLKSDNLSKTKKGKINKRAHGP